MCRCDTVWCIYKYLQFHQVRSSIASQLFVLRSSQSLFYVEMYHECCFTCTVCLVTQCKVRSSIILSSPRHAETLCDAAVGVCNYFAEGHMVHHHFLLMQHSSLRCLCHQNISSVTSLNGLYCTTRMGSLYYCTMSDTVKHGVRVECTWLVLSSFIVIVIESWCVIISTVLFHLCNGFSHKT